MLLDQAVEDAMRSLDPEREMLEAVADHDARIAELEVRLVLAEGDDADEARRLLALETEARTENLLSGLRKMIGSDRVNLKVFLLKVKLKAAKLANGMRMFKKEDFLKSGHAAKLPFADLERVRVAAADAHGKLARAAGNPSMVEDGEIAEAGAAVARYGEMTDFVGTRGDATPSVSGAELHRSVIAAHKMAQTFVKMHTDAFKWRERLLSAAAKLYGKGPGWASRKADAARRASELIARFKTLCRNAANQLFGWIEFQLQAVEHKAGRSA